MSTSTSTPWCRTASSANSRRAGSTSSRRLPPSDVAVVGVLATIRRRLRRLLASQGLELGAVDQSAADGPTEALLVMAQLVSASVRGRVTALGAENACYVDWPPRAHRTRRPVNTLPESGQSRSRVEAALLSHVIVLLSIARRISGFQAGAGRRRGRKLFKCREMR